MSDKDNADVDAALKKVVEQLAVGEVRDGQMTMARAVMSAIADERHLVIRAGTGTGKSLGYLVPAVVSKKRVIVATATKALQDQLAANDLPLVAKGVDRDFTYEVLKGRSNYLCMQRVKETENAGLQGALDDGTDGGDISRGRFAEDVEKLLEWSRTTGTGDQAELDEEPHPKVWGAFSVSADECPGAFRCPSGSGCFAEAARQRADAADVVVVNLHLIGSDIASGGMVLPEHDVLIVDEAHEFESIVSSSLGGSISSARIKALAGLSKRSKSDAKKDRPTGNEETASHMADQLIEVADRFDRVISAKVGERLTSPMDKEFVSVIELLSSRLERLERVLRKASGEGSEPSQEASRALLASARLRELVSRLITFDEKDVAWVEGGSRSSIVIAPIDVSAILKEQVFSQRSVILTSATVPMGIAERLGADVAQVDEFDVGSPFDYEHNGILYCAAHLPDRRQEGAEDMVIDELAGLIEAAGGRTLALFTSWSAMNKAVEKLRKRLDYKILAQGEQSKGALLTAFRDDHAACLFATMSFWQGVDVPGHTLSLVVIDRIPFPRPDDPLLSARRDRIGRNAFKEIDLPRAASLLAQGAGRLIRTADDRGVVAILDSRLAKASYRWDLINALPPMKRSKDRAEVEAFLREIAKSAEAADKK